MAKQNEKPKTAKRTICPSCKGDGFLTATRTNLEMFTCPTCGGTGKLESLGEEHMRKVHSDNSECPDGCGE